MKAWRLNGGLVLGKEPIPAPGPGEVLVRMRAAAINARDLAIHAGAYPNKPALIPFSDGAGVVEAVGVGVKDFTAGDAVVTCFYPFWESGPATEENHRASLGCEIDGVLAEYALIPASGLVAKPEVLNFTQAATLPCAALTAWSALFTEGRLRAGEIVLIQGTGGVALFALQLAKMAGARIVILSGSDEKLARATALGADVTINYRTAPDWASAVRNATDGNGVDLIVEVGGADTLAQSMDCVRVGGRISVIGVLSGLVAAIPVPAMLFRHIHMTGITVGHRADFRALCAAIAANGIIPVIDQCFDFENAASGYAELPKGKHFGKLVVEL